ncbi:MAG: DUF3854 domain-containing protein, partial [Planctomycetes bacterium]|nr:DUF3854 domain-containing protein [Planctomycetota bacterium]
MILDLRPSVKSLNRAHKAQLAASGIPPEEAARRGIQSWDEDQVQTYLGRAKPVGPGLALAYPDPVNGGFLKCPAGGNGSEIDFVRIRLDDPSRALDSDEKPAKYLSRRGSGQQPYILREVADAIRANPEAQILLVEGEKKALSATLHGVPAIGLAGNWGWKQKDRHALQPLLARFISRGARVVVIWDSDAALNTGFAIATRMLHEGLRKRGCRLKVIVLPQEGSQKVGLDDFLVAHGPQAAKDLIRDADFLSADKPLPVDDLMLSWLPSVAGALKNLRGEEAEKLLDDFFRKALFDGLGDSTRDAILEKLDEATKVDVLGRFHNYVGQRLEEDYGADVWAREEFLRVGFSVEIPGGRRGVVTRLEGPIAWVGPSRNGRSRPYPTGCLVSTAAGGYHTLAHKFVSNRYGELVEITLRCYQGQFLRWVDGGYVSAQELEITSEVMGFLRDSAPAIANIKTCREVIAQLKAEGLCFIPASVQPPAWLDGRAHP